MRIFTLSHFGYKWRSFHRNFCHGKHLPVTAYYYRMFPVLPVCNANNHVLRKITTSLFLLPTLTSGVNIRENTSSGSRDTAPDAMLPKQSALSCSPVANTLALLLAHVRCEFSGKSLQWKSRYSRKGTMQCNPSKLPLITDRSEPNLENFSACEERAKYEFSAQAL
jgi:hypothetical protein